MGMVLTNRREVFNLNDVLEIGAGPSHPSNASPPPPRSNQSHLKENVTTAKIKHELGIVYLGSRYAMLVLAPILSVFHQVSNYLIQEELG
jgi:hypothetical protein